MMWFLLYVFGELFGFVDIVVWVYLLVIGMVMKVIFGCDFLFDVGIDWKVYVKMVGECLVV